MLTSVLTFPAPHNRFAGIEPGDLNEVEAGSLVELALAALDLRYRPRKRLATPQETQAYLRLRLAGCERETFGALFLAPGRRVVAVEELFFGTIDRVSVHPRVVLQRALQLDAGAVILYHYAPWGLAEPSPAQRILTAKLKDALALVEIQVLDHVVVGAEGCVSFAERGWL